MKLDVGKIKHDVNSNLSSIHQALEIINENMVNNPEVIQKVAPLALEKVKGLIKDWEEIKRSLDDR